MATPKRDIKYLNRDFTDFRNRLIEFTQTYFPNTYNDFSPASPGMLMMEQSAYVGDVLSFYLDNQIQENFLQYARQTNNIFELAYMFGYKPKTTSVKAHKRTYTNMKPVKLSTGEWRILKGMPATKGKAPLDKAVNKVMNNEFQIATWITQFFK